MLCVLNSRTLCNQSRDINFLLISNNSARTPSTVSLPHKNVSFPLPLPSSLLILLCFLFWNSFFFLLSLCLSLSSPCQCSHPAPFRPFLYLPPLLMCVCRNTNISEGIPCHAGDMRSTSEISVYRLCFAFYLGTLSHTLSRSLGLVLSLKCVCVSKYVCMYVYMPHTYLHACVVYAIELVVPSVSRQRHSAHRVVQGSAGAAHVGGSQTRRFYLTGR